MKVLQTNKKNPTKYQGITNQQKNPKYKERIANRLTTKPLKQ